MSIKVCNRMLRDCPDRTQRGHCEASNYDLGICDQWSRQNKKDSTCKLCKIRTTELTLGLCYGCNSGVYIK